ncbi:hypothetical protein RN001_008327 [Aquatica leii]|uniref:Mitochondrial ribosomal protein S34 n=1 Tax=Aquatica leii TaxID=1421715 RepID=A0AAN7PD62_9COLE|nr:hypothetical protein RN001_008327 [Aquatica leii]
MPVKYIGKTVDFKGKTLWEIVGNLKNFGVGRVVVRSMFERYPEPSYLKILKVETLPNPDTNTPDDVRKVKVWVEKTFRGRTFPEPIPMLGSTYKADYRLIPKDEVDDYCKCSTPRIENKILPKTTTFPPILWELIVRGMKANKQPIIEPELPLVYTQGRESYYRAAKDNENPNAELQKGFGPPVTSTL